jgi:hypothetical protein
MNKTVFVLFFAFVAAFSFYVPVMYVPAAHSPGTFYRPFYESLTHRFFGEGAIFSVSRGYYLCSNIECARVSSPGYAAIRLVSG